MEGIAPVLIVGLIVCVVAAGWYFSWLAAKKRREAFQALAERLGMRYTEHDNSLDDRYRFLNKLDQGSNRYAFNVIEGRYSGHAICLFDYHYETHSRDSKGRRQTHHHYFSFFILNQSRRFPELRIYPESFLSKLGQMIGFDDIDFESAEFSRAFTVRSNDKKFAYDVCHTRMMEYLLARRDLSIEIEGHSVAIGCDRRLKPEEIEGRIRQLVEIRELFPEYLYKD